MAIQLGPKERENLRQELQRLKRWLSSDRAVKIKRQQQEHINFFQNILPTRIKSGDFSEADIMQMVNNLWTFETRWWNRTTKVSEIIRDNGGISAVAGKLAALLDRSRPLETRYNEALKSKKIKHFGPAVVTEILAYLHPNDCAIWNSVTRGAIKRLGLTSLFKARKNGLSFDEYQRLNEVTRAIAVELKNYDLPKRLHPIDLLTVDLIFFWGVMKAETSL